jgi:hypothetical protein
VYKVSSSAVNAGCVELDENIKECKKFSYSFSNYNSFFGGRGRIRCKFVNAYFSLV